MRCFLDICEKNYWLSRKDNDSYLSHSYGILQGNAFKKLIRNVMQQVNEEKMVIFENQQGFFYDIYIRDSLGNQTWQS